MLFVALNSNLVSRCKRHINILPMQKLELVPNDKGDLTELRIVGVIANFSNV
jgi:hypothetical protein